MKKDKKWLKDKIKDEEYNLKYVYNNFVPYEKVLIADDVYDLIKQLDEPEKPVIPQFVADFIRATKPSNSLRLAFEYIAQRKIDNYDDELALWIEEGNSELFASAWLDGYEVEKEKRYYISDETDNATLMTFDLSDEDGEELIEFVAGYSENETIHFDSKEKAELIARFVGDSVKVEEVME